MGAITGALTGLAGAVLLFLTRRAIEQGTYLPVLDVVLAWQKVLPVQLGLGAIAGLAVSLSGSRGVVARLLGWAVAGTCFGLVTSNLWSDSIPSLLHHVRWFSRQLAYLEIGLLAALGLSTLLLTRQAASRLSTSRALSLLGVALVGLYLLPLHGGRLLTRLGGGTIQITEVVREIAVEPDAWRVQSAHPFADPSVGVISPSRDYRLDAGELPSIVMPPPASLSFTVRPEDGPTVLRFAAGADRELDSPRTKRLLDRATGGRRFAIRFRVLRNGEVISKHLEPAVLEQLRSRSQGNRRWIRQEPGEDIQVAPGDVITLETAVVGLPEEVAEKLPVLKVGFGEVTLERSRQVPAQTATEDAPNIVLIVQDTMRADRSSTYGYGRTTTPHLSRLADRGVLYEHARSTASWTWPATASLLTGLQPEAHGVTDDDACYLTASNRTLAEALQERGLVTGAFTCNPLVSEQKNFDQGFNTFKNDPQRFVKTDRIIGDVRSWLQLHRSQRFFLYLHLVDPHMPLEPLGEHMKRLVVPKPELFKGTVQDTFRQFQKLTLAPGGVNEDGTPRFAKLPPRQLDYISSVYDAAVATGDHYLGLVLDELELLGLSDRTVIAFTSDHGEALFDHKDIAHGQSLHPELIEVPLVLAGPGLPVGVRSEVPVSNRHLAHTLAVIGGALLDAPHAPLMLADPASIEPHAVYSSTTHGQWNFRPGRQTINGVREGAWSLHHAPTGTDFRVPATEASPEGQLRLYDIRVDPGEQEDVAGQHPEVAEELRRQLLSELERQRRSRGTKVTLGAGSSTLDLLDDIGYTIGKE